MTSLEQVLASHFGDRITDVSCRPSLYASSLFVNEIDIRLDDGATVGLMAKAADREAKWPEAPRAKPAFLWNDQRERATYESILAGVDVGSARYFGSFVDATGVRYLLLERIAGIRLSECDGLEPWREAARWLARLHGRVSVEKASASRAAPHLLRYDRAFYESWRHRAERFQSSHADLSRLAATHRHVVDRLLYERTSFLHGEFYSANVWVVRRADAIVVRPIDWEMASLGPALMDLAYLLAGRWTDDERADVADAYVRELARHALDTPRREHCLRTLDCCLIHLSVQNLGWSDAWTLPSDHTYDWLGEGLRLCERWQL